MEKITVTNNYQFCSFRRVKRIGSLLLFLSKQKKKKSQDVMLRKSSKLTQSLKTQLVLIISVKGLSGLLGHLRILYFSVVFWLFFSQYSKHS